MKAKYGILDEDTFNFDETGFMMGLIFAGMALPRRMIVRRLNWPSLEIGNGQP
jgi:hypothetical protein